MKAVLRLAVALAAGSLCGVAFAQGNAGESFVRQPPVPVTVTFFADDGHGNPIRGLQQSDISILDSGKPPQSVTAFRSAKELPLRIGIVIENGLPWLAYEDAAKAALDFLPKVLSGSDDRAFVTTYATISSGIKFLTRDQISKLTPEMILPPRASPPSDRSSVPATEWRNTKMTWTYDAIVLASAAMESDPVQPDRRILIVVGDKELGAGRHWSAAGRMSKAGYSKSLEAAQRSDAMIFGISEFRASVSWLTEQTGGYPWALRERARVPKPSYSIWSGFPDAFENIKAQMDYMYSVSYVPANP